MFQLVASVCPQLILLDLPVVMLILQKCIVPVHGVETVFLGAGSGGSNN